MEKESSVSAALHDELSCLILFGDIRIHVQQWVPIGKLYYEIYVMILPQISFENRKK